MHFTFPIIFWDHIIVCIGYCKPFWSTCTISQSYFSVLPKAILRNSYTSHSRFPLHFWWQFGIHHCQWFNQICSGKEKILVSFSSSIWNVKYHFTILYYKISQWMLFCGVSSQLSLLLIETVTQSRTTGFCWGITEQTKQIFSYFNHIRMGS